MWTRKSTLLTGVALTLLLLGGVFLSLPAAILGLVALAFVGVNFFLFRKDAIVHAARAIEVERVFEADSVAIDLTVENRGKRVLFLEVRDRLPRTMNVESGSNYAFLALNRDESQSLRYEVRCPLLGAYDVGPLSLRLEDPFGLFYEERDALNPQSLWVLPRTEDLRKAALLSRLPMPLLGEHQVNRPGDGFDFFAIREYVAGDTQKMINWKASARTGKLLVNQMERVTSAEGTILYDARAIVGVGPEDQSPRVLGARACASVAEWLHRKRDLVQLFIYSDHVREIEPAPADRQMPLILLTLAELQPKGDVPLKYVVDEVLPSLRPSSPIIIVSPLLDDPTIVEAASTLLANDMVLVILSPKPPEIPGATPEFAAALMADRERALSALRGYGAFVVDLKPGQSLAANLEKGVIA